jgi:hypothetical protein
MGLNMTTPLMTLTLTQQASMERLKKIHPMPFYLERRNRDGVEVRDNRGNIVMQEEFYSVDAAFQQEVRDSAFAVAEFLVAISGGLES